MTLISVDGRPLGTEQASPQLLGWIVMRQNGTALEPLTNEKGLLAIFNAPQVAIDTAKEIADRELRPSAEQKVVTPMMKSHRYVVVQCAVVGVIQAEIKNPSQLLAPEGKGVN